MVSQERRGQGGRNEQHDESSLEVLNKVVVKAVLNIDRK
jgi:hypothetical protein